MQLKLYSIRDSKGESYSTPFFQRTHGEAERSFAQLTKDPKSTIHDFPEDYDLYYVAQWDDSTGSIVGLDTPQHIIKAIHVTPTQN